jgi:hypothetical protein
MTLKKKEKDDFEECSCGKKWKTRDGFLRDKSVKIVGYQPDLINHRYNHFLFFHRLKSCGQFFGIRASEFKDLRTGKCPKELNMGQEDCPGYCTDTMDLRVCSVACRNATDREVAARISRRRLLKRIGTAATKKPSPARTAGKRA